MPQGFPTRSMAAKNGRSEPLVVVEGIEDIIERDLNKHRALLEQAKQNVLIFREARSHEIQRKKHYKSLIGGGKYDDDALRKEMQDMNVNIRNLSDKVKRFEEEVQFHTGIVDKLSVDYTEQMKKLKALDKYRRNNASPN